LTWADVLPRDEGRVQFSITGKGSKVRQSMIRYSQAAKVAAG
jgi:hypothetical protein